MLLVINVSCLIHNNQCDMQELLGSIPEGFDEYFGSRFPRLLMEVYNVMYQYCKEEKWFYKYLG